MPIRKETLSFLKGLKENNNRDWFKSKSKEYQKAKENVLEFASSFLESTFPEYENQELDPKKSLFRINRDIRFSKDKTPYKTHFGLVLHPEGRKTTKPGLYLQINPENSLIASGIWNPDKEQLYAIRQEIDYTGNEFNEIIKGLDKFEISTKNSLKRPPKGYDKENKNINYIKLKNFVVSRPIQSDLLLQEDFYKKLQTEYKSLKPFLDFLGRALEV